METKFNKLQREFATTEDTQRKQTLQEFFEVYSMLPENKKALVSLVLCGGGHKFVSVETTTDKIKDLNAVARKNIHTAICKSTINCSINKVYENAVNNERTREDEERTFIASPRNWGKRVCNEIVIHKGMIYLTLYPITTKAKYYCNGHEISFNEFQTYLQPSKTKEYREAQAKEKQGVEKVIVYRDFKLDSINAMRYNDNEIVIR